jgi:hypothetical protein
MAVIVGGTINFIIDYWFSEYVFLAVCQLYEIILTLSEAWGLNIDASFDIVFTIGIVFAC